MNAINKPRKQIKILKDLDFKNMEEYFNYIIDSSYNGQLSQIKDLYNNLNKNNKRQFFFYCSNNGYLAIYNKIMNIV